MATRRRKTFEDACMFIRFDRIHERDRRIDTALRHKPRLCIASRDKKGRKLFRSYCQGNMSARKCPDLVSHELFDCCEHVAFAVGVWRVPARRDVTHTLGRWLYGRRWRVVSTRDVEPWPQLCQLKAPTLATQPVYYILYTARRLLADVVARCRHTCEQAMVEVGSAAAWGSGQSPSDNSSSFFYMV